MIRTQVTYAASVGILLAASGTLHAQTQYVDNPLIYSRGILNAASFMPAGLAGGSIAQGSIFTIFGALLGPAAGVKATSYPLATTLAGVSVKVSQGNTSVDAIPIYVSASQINAIMPSNAPLGRASVQVTYNTANPYVRPASSNAPVNVVPSSFGILAVNSAGFGPGIFTDASYNYVTLAAPAKPGQAILIWGTGLGAITGADTQAPTPGSLPTRTEVFVGGRSAPLLYNGRAPCCSGLDQIAFTVPPDAPTGCWVPVQVRTGGTVVSNTTTLAISPDGSPCSDPFNPIAQPYLAGKAASLVILHRVDLLLDQLVDARSEPVADFAYARMLQPDSNGAFFFNSLISLPPPGSCTTYAFAGNITGGTLLPGVNQGGKLLDAGSPLTVSGAPVRQLPGVPVYDQLIGSSDAAVSSSPLTFQPPSPAPISGPGGPDVGPFQASVPTAAGINWTNRASLNTLDRTQPLTVTWDPSSTAGSPVILVGGNVDTPHNASGVFLCSAPGTAGSFAVPPAILANVPATGRLEVLPKGMLLLFAVPLAGASPFNATGLSAGAAVYSSWLGKTVTWK